ncbi:unnamed protein product [Rhizophagus irregularis]|uniref:Uncharacterized protein n=1 Tax=Rhizophagus irregularis TaxID=588596 RepID=A0A915Z8Z1_9GLOM|nr:unnamed protein product [Rhizophagus irregularis]
MKNNKLVWLLSCTSSTTTIITITTSNTTISLDCSFYTFTNIFKLTVKANIKERECLVIVLIVLFSIIGKVGDEGMDGKGGNSFVK